MTKLLQQVLSEIMQVTPELARRWLDEQPRNRRMTQLHVERLARDMKEGRFQFNGEPLIFDTKGRLLDGQQRLAALVLAGVTLPFLVVRGIQPRAQETMDGGKSRAIFHALQIRGVKYAAETGAALRVFWVWFQCQKFVGSGGFIPRVPSTSELLRIYDGLVPDLEPAATEAAMIRQNLQLTTGAITGFCWLLPQIHREKARGFLGKLASGEDLRKGDPVYALRESLIRQKGQRLQATGAARTALLIKAWNQHYEELPIQHLFWRKDEPFPLVVGSRGLWERWSRKFFPKQEQNGHEE